MVSIFKVMIEVALLSSIMIVSILMLRLIFQDKLSIKITMLLWLLVMIRLILPFTIQSPVQIIGLFPHNTNTEVETLESDIAKDEIETTDTDNIAINQTQEDSTATDVQQKPVQMETVETSIDAKVQEKSNLFGGLSLIEILCYIWLVGVFVSLVINIVWIIIFNNKVKESAFLSDKLIAQKIYNDCYKLNIGKNVSVYECDYIDSPITCGVIRPKILLPADLITNVGKQKAELIIFHELIHIKNFDILKSYVWMFAKVIYWFNPLIYLGYHKYLEDVELNCDNAVKQKHSKQEILHYSQGLLDVLKLSQGEIKLPTAMPFCKTKIRKRVETMLKPEKKWKVATVVSYAVIAILIVGCFTTACMKKESEIETDDIIVEPKIKQAETVESKTEVDSEKIQQNSTTNSEFVNVFDYWTNDEETVTVEIDAEVEMPVPKTMPVAQIEQFKISPELAEHIAKTFFGDVPMIDGTIYTKSMYEQALANIEESATDMNSDMATASGAKNLEELRKVADIQIEKVKKAMKDAPETASEVDFEDIDSSMGLISNVDIGKEYTGTIYAENNSTSPQRGIRCFAFGSGFKISRKLDYSAITPADMNNLNKDAEKGKELAEKLVSDMGIDGVKLGRIYLSDDYTGLMSEDNTDQELQGISSDRRFYVYVFEREVNGKLIDFSLVQGDYKNPYERIEVWVEDSDKIRQFSWISPKEVVDVISESAEIKIDYLQAVELMKEASINKFVDKYGFYDHFNVYVDNIQFEYLGVNIDDQWVSTPVWVFYGEAFGRITEKVLEDPGNSDKEVGDYSRQTVGFTRANIMMCINALDGSVIELEPRS